MLMQISMPKKNLIIIIIIIIAIYINAEPWSCQALQLDNELLGCFNANFCPVVTWCSSWMQELVQELMIVHIQLACSPNNRPDHHLSWAWYSSWIIKIYMITRRRKRRRSKINLRGVMKLQQLQQYGNDFSWALNMDPLIHEAPSIHQSSEAVHELIPNEFIPSSTMYMMQGIRSAASSCSWSN